MKSELSLREDKPCHGLFSFDACRALRCGACWHLSCCSWERERGEVSQVAQPLNELPGELANSAEHVTGLSFFPQPIPGNQLHGLHPSFSVIQ